MKKHKDEGLALLQMLEPCIQTLNQLTQALEATTAKNAAQQKLLKMGGRK